MEGLPLEKGIRVLAPQGPVTARPRNGVSFYKIQVIMSFGYSAGDFLLAIALAKKVYEACKEGPGQYREISREAQSVQYAISSLSEDAEDQDSLLNRKGQNRKGQLLEIIRNCKCTLQEVQDLIEKHSSLQSNQAGRSRRLWDAYRVGRCDLDSLRGQLTFHTSVIEGFLLSLQGPAIGRIETKLEKILSHLIQADAEIPRRQSISSSVSTLSILSQQIDNDEDGAWEYLKSELLADGVSTSLVKANQERIMEFIKNLIREAPAQDPIQRNAEVDYLPRILEPSEPLPSFAVRDYQRSRLQHTSPHRAGDLPHSYEKVISEGGCTVRLIRYATGGSVLGLRTCSAIFNVCFSSAPDKAHRQGQVNLNAEHSGVEGARPSLNRSYPQEVEGFVVPVEETVPKSNGVWSGRKNSPYQRHDKKASQEWSIRAGTHHKSLSSEDSGACWVVYDSKELHGGLPNITIGAMWAISDEMSERDIHIHVAIARFTGTYRTLYSPAPLLYDSHAEMRFKLPAVGKDDSNLFTHSTHLRERKFMREQVAASYARSAVGRF